MGNYYVTVTYQVEETLRVEARDESAARQKALTRRSELESDNYDETDVQIVSVERDED